MVVHTYQADPNCKHSRIIFRACVQLPLYVYGIDDSIKTQMLKTPHCLLLHLEALDNGINTDICTLKKEKGYIFSERCTESFKPKYLRYVNEVIFEMVKTALKDAYLGGTTPTEVQNEVATCRQIYYDKENQVMINQSLNEFYTCLLLKIDSLPQEVGFPLDIAATFFNNLSPDVRDFLI